MSSRESPSGCSQSSRLGVGVQPLPDLADPPAVVLASGETGSTCGLSNDRTCPQSPSSPVRSHPALFSPSGCDVWSHAGRFRTQKRVWRRLGRRAALPQLCAGAAMGVGGPRHRPLLLGPSLLPKRRRQLADVHGAAQC